MVLNLPLTEVQFQCVQAAGAYWDVYPHHSRPSSWHVACPVDFTTGKDACYELSEKGRTIATRSIRQTEGGSIELKRVNRSVTAVTGITAGERGLTDAHIKWRVIASDLPPGFASCVGTLPEVAATMHFRRFDDGWRWEK